MTDGRTEPITFYLTAEEKQALQREADDADESLSSHVTRLVRRQRQLDAEEEISENLNPEERLLEIAREATDQIEDSVAEVEHAATDLRDMQARSGVYSIANFELLKDGYADPRRQDALRTGRNRLRQPIEDHNAVEDANTGQNTSDTGDNADDNDNGDDLEERLNRD